jgi:hypothetical protein
VWQPCGGGGAGAGETNSTRPSLTLSPPPFSDMQANMMYVCRSTRGRCGRWTVWTGAWTRWMHTPRWKPSTPQQKHGNLSESNVLQHAGTCIHTRNPAGAPSSAETGRGRSGDEPLTPTAPYSTNQFKPAFSHICDVPSLPRSVPSGQARTFLGGR